MRKSKSRINKRGLVVLFITLLMSTMLSGCALKAINNTSENMNLYQSENQYGDKIVVDKDGKWNVYYRIDVFGNIENITSDDKVVLRRNVKEYEEGIDYEQICVIPVNIETVNPQQNEIITVPEPAPEVIINLNFETENVKDEEIIIVEPTKPDVETAIPVPATRQKAEELGTALFKYVENSISFLTEEAINNVSGIQTIQTTASLNDVKPIEEKVEEPNTTVQIIENTPHNHIWDEGEIVVNPDCKREGLISYRCTDCGQISDKTLAKTEHIYFNGICQMCGFEDSTYIKPQHIHEYTYAYEISAPSCTKEGRCMYICNCNDNREESIKALGHNYINGICDRCGEISKEEHTHNYIKSYTEKEASCIDIGIDVYTCICGQENRVETQGKHQYRGGICTVCSRECSHDWEIIEYREADCYSKGIENKRCKDCNITEITDFNKTHCYDNNGKCTVCGYEDTDIYTAYGRSLKNSGLSDYEKMMDIVNFVVANCHGDCIQYSYAAISAGNECGLYSYYRHVNNISCPVEGCPHSEEMFILRNGYCQSCGMGNNHHWIRFELSDGNFYEFDLQGLGTYYAGPNKEIHEAYFNNR